MSAVKEEVRRLVDELPEDATWDDVLQAVYLKQVLQQGIADLRAGRTITHEEVRRSLGLDPRP